MEKENFVIQEEKPKLGWNWGAFMHPILFGFANKAYLCFLTLIPVIGVFWQIICGIKGADWASKNFNGTKEFNAVMNSWNRAGLLSFIVFVIGIVLYVLLIGSVYGIVAGLVSSLSY